MDKGRRCVRQTGVPLAEDAVRTRDSDVRVLVLWDGGGAGVETGSAARVVSGWGWFVCRLVRNR